MDKENLWEKVGNKCLQQAEKLLDSETAPTAATVETVKGLVETAISIDMTDLRWVEQSRYGAAVLPSRTLCGQMSIATKGEDRACDRANKAD